MNPDHDFNPPELQRLLALKRQEQPPPGFFLHFSDKVIARIEAKNALDQNQGWKRWLAALDLRPLAACAYGVGLGAALFGGISASAVFEHNSNSQPDLSGSPWLALTSEHGPRPVVATMGTQEPPEILATTHEASSTVPVFSSTPPNFLLNRGQPEVQTIHFGR